MKSLKRFRFPAKRRLRPGELYGVYRTLHKAFGHRQWWPGKTPFEVMIGAILTQNTAWSNVEKAIRNLKRAGKLSPKALHSLPEKELAELIRPSGYFNVKARRLKFFLRFLFEEYGGRLERMFAEDGGALRRKLLLVNGIGPETADSILLYAAAKPFFVIDAYTKRIFTRHRLKTDGGARHASPLRLEDPYEIWQSVFAEALEPVVRGKKRGRLDLYNDFHAQIVMLAKDYCKSREALCGSCPLSKYL